MRGVAIVRFPSCSAFGLQRLRFGAVSGPSPQAPRRSQRSASNMRVRTSERRWLHRSKGSSHKFAQYGGRCEVGLFWRGHRRASPRRVVLAIVGTVPLRDRRCGSSPSNSACLSNARRYMFGLAGKRRASAWRFPQLPERRGYVRREQAVAAAMLCKRIAGRAAPPRRAVVVETKAQLLEIAHQRKAPVGREAAAPAAGAAGGGRTRRGGGQAR